MLGLVVGAPLKRKIKKNSQGIFLLEKLYYNGIDFHKYFACK
jgi:hypothetical protein